METGACPRRGDNGSQEYGQGHGSRISLDASSGLGSGEDPAYGTGALCGTGAKTIGAGEDQAWRPPHRIALEYYGNKLFWVYIYQHNKAVIKDPNNVPIGTVIEIPAPESYGIDAKSRESREKAAALQTEILAGE